MEDERIDVAITPEPIEARVAVTDEENADG
jgi:hypothetical protein